MVLAISANSSVSSIFQRGNIHGGLGVSREGCGKILSNNFCVCNNFGCTTDIISNQGGLL